MPQLHDSWSLKPCKVRTDAEDSYLLAHYTMQHDRQLPMFQRNKLPPSSGQKMLTPIYETTLVSHTRKQWNAVIGASLKSHKKWWHGNPTNS
jgi:hypothetical protein